MAAVAAVDFTVVVRLAAVDAAFPPAVVSVEAARLRADTVVGLDIAGAHTVAAVGTAERIAAAMDTVAVTATGEATAMEGAVGVIPIGASG